MSTLRRDYDRGDATHNYFGRDIAKGEMLRPNPPPPPAQPPMGYEVVVCPDSDWKTVEGANEPGKRCRWSEHGKTCGRAAVCAFDRGSVNRPNWWAYCELHMYGRWIENGVVCYWGLAELGPLP